METILSMNTKELSRLEVIQRLSKKQMSQKEAGEILHLGRRQIKRLLERYRKQGAAGLISKHRGRQAANRLSESVKKQGLDLLKTKYQGFGPTLAHEKLVEKEKLQLSVESVLDKRQHFAEADDRGRFMETAQIEKGRDASTTRTTDMFRGTGAN